MLPCFERRRSEGGVLNAWQCCAGWEEDELRALGKDAGAVVAPGAAAESARSRCRSCVVHYNT